MSANPRVTVLMSVYNSADFLREAIDSILNQTFKDFEFLIINDGSKDKSLDIIKSYKDRRIVLVSRPNKGLVASLNEGISLAKGEYIARQDSDDISVKHRLKTEVEFLDSHPSVALVGSNYAHIDKVSKCTGTVTNIFTNSDDLKVALVTCNQYGHGSIMMRSSILEKVGMYDRSVGHVEDYDLWLRISRVADVANIEEPLYLYRKNEKGVTQQNLDLQIEQTFAIRDKAFEHFLKNRHDYRVLARHPSGHHYRDRKAVLYRDLAFLYRQAQHHFQACLMLLLAIAFQPSNKKNYRLLAKSFLKPRSKNWSYEFL